MTAVAPVQALCLSCSQVTAAVYEYRSDGVFLVRHCATCGTTQARITKDRGFFDRVASAAAGAQPVERGLIVELIDGCNIECPTCIAGSGLLLGNPRAVPLLKRRIASVLGRSQLNAILLSGGEPTIHPEFFDLVSYTASLNVPARVLITNGLRFATEIDFVERFVDAGGAELEVFLQWDSVRSEALIDLRGADYSAERRSALDALAEHNVTTTLVNVVKRGVTLSHINEVLATARQSHNVVGVQFQPIRDAGRVLNFRWEDNSCDVVDIFDQFPGRVRLTPCTSSPWSTFLGWMDRSTGTINASGPEDTFYISPTNSTAPDRVRIAVLDYSDRYNWTSERARLASLNILDHRGQTPSVDDYFLGIAS